MKSAKGHNPSLKQYYQILIRHPIIKGAQLEPKKWHDISMNSWTVYILRCADTSLYTGITNDLPRRLAAHNAGKGAKYTRGRTPATIVHTEDFPDRSSASKREHQIKTLTKQEKIALYHAHQQ